MDKAEAERLYDSGKDPTVEKILEYDRENQKLKEKVARLERTSQSSSKPPSSDLTRERNGQKRQHTNSPKRKAGGQPGHPGSHRNLLPPEQVDETIECFARECRDCRRFQQCRAQAVRHPPVSRWQVTEIPSLKPTVSEYQLFTLCGECGKAHPATLPVEVGRSNFGPRLTAMIAYFTAVLKQPRRVVQDCFQTVFATTLALGSTQNLLTQTSQALAPVDEALRNALPRQKVINADESGWYRRWVWVFLTSSFAYFHIARSRGSAVLQAILGPLYDGILCVDRWGAYTKYHKGLLQLCWAHLKRDICAILETGKALGSVEARSFARRMEMRRKRLMKVWYRYKTGKIKRNRLIRLSQPIRQGMEKLLFASRDCTDRSVRSFARRLYKLRAHLFTFIDYEGVEPTNNSSERTIRVAVLWRKICFGNKTDGGAIVSARLLTVTRSCWLQKRNALEFLVEAITAHRRGLPAPLLSS
jgi:transposase